MRLETAWRGTGEIPDGATAPVVGMGLVLAVAGVVHALVASASPTVRLVELSVPFLVPTGLATGGWWLAERDVPTSARWRVTTWASVGIVATCGGVGALLWVLTLQGGAIADPLAPITTLTPVGGAAGFSVGVWTISEAGPSATVARPTESRSGTTGPRDPQGGTAADPPADGPRPDAPTAERAIDDEDATGPDDGPTLERVAPESISASATTALEIAADDRARVALSLVYHAPGVDSWTVEDLAAAVADRTDADPDRTETALRHATLPRLEAAGTIERHGEHVTAPDHAIFEEGVREATAVLAFFEPGTR